MVYKYEMYFNDIWNDVTPYVQTNAVVGDRLNQTFNIYIGLGRNGKSKLVDLMSKVLGDYKATVPITLLTQKRI